jgi:L-fucose isomerase
MVNDSNRFDTPLPKIGIRPTVDGRLGGARESIEGQTLQQARAVADLITRELRHPSGHSVECVIPDFCIGGRAETARAATLFEQAGVRAILTVSPSWCYGSETMELDNRLPQAYWGFNGPERPGAVYLAAVLAGHNQKGLPAFGIYGRDVRRPDDLSIPSDVREKILCFVRAALAVATMRGKGYLALGGVSMGIAGSMVDADFFQQYLGMHVESVDMSEVLRRMQRTIYDPCEFEVALKWVRAKCIEGVDPNPPERHFTAAEREASWAAAVQMTLIVRDLMIGNPALAQAGFGEEALGHHALIAGFQGQRHWTDFMVNGDFMEAVLNSSFDWHGPRQPFVVATENDSLNAVTMLFGHLLTATAQVFADVRTYWSPAAIKQATGWEPQGSVAGGVLHLINSGPAALDGTGAQSRAGQPALKPFWEINDAEIDQCLQATTWHPSQRMFFPGGGFSTRYRTRGGMPATMARLNLVKGIGPVLQLAEGVTAD